MSEATGKWKLNMGCHRKTMTSRDSRVTSHDSYEECWEAYQTEKKVYSKIGYYVWFAKITDPEGNIKFHDKGVPYH